MLGSTAPDWIEFLLRFGGYNIKHRGATHVVLYWVLGLVLGFMPGFSVGGILIAFCYGGLTHVFCDSLTSMGVPLTWWSLYRRHLFGGKFTTGQPGEYMVGFGTALVCATLISVYNPSTGESPFFRNYPRQYNDGAVDLHEWRERRFEFF